MLYTILKPVMKAALRLYFGRIVLRGMEHIDNGRPTLILANHTASFMDAVITACFIKRRIYFFTRGDVFKHRWADKILRSLGMLPVYRLIDGRDKLQLNDSSNEEALKILARGGAVLIFVEGASDIAKVLKPLKKGPFRLAVTAAATLPEAPMLVPMGINYITPTKPFGDVFLNAAPPFSAADFPADTEASAAKAATDMMRVTAAAIRPLVWHIEKRDNVPAGDALLALLKDIKPGYGFADTQLLLGRLNNDAAVRAAWEEYMRWQRQRRVDNACYSKAPGSWEWLLLIAGLPVAIAGLVGSFIPIAIAKGIADKKVKEPDFWAAVFLSCAVLCVSLWFGWIIAQGVYGKNPGRIPMVIIAIAASGVFCLKVYLPVLRKAIGLCQRATYSRRNPSHALVERLQASLRRIIGAAVGSD